jgi:tetratricopeptide (TPR) repeat protein
MSGMLVIGRSTAFTYKGMAIDLKQIGRELNVRYVLEGSVQRGDNRMRVNVQLLETESGNHLWAERFDKPVADLFDVQDEIVSRLANALNAQLVTAEARRAERAPNPDSMDLYFEGKACANKGWNPEHMGQARAFFERALALDPGNIEALVGTAVLDVTSVLAFLTDDRARCLAAAEEILIGVLSLAPDHALAHGYLGIAQILSNRPDQGIAELERALALDQNFATANVGIGYAKLLIGRGEETEKNVLKALRLSPHDIGAPVWLLTVGVSKLSLGSDLEAVTWLRRSIEGNRNYPNAHFWLAAALAHIGRLDEAQSAVRVGLALNSGFTIHRFQASAVSDNPTYLARRERFYEGLRKAGLPEQ